MSGLIVLGAAAAVLLALLIGGLVLLILGIARKRTGLWVTGLVVLLVMPFLLLPLVGLVIWFSADMADWTENRWSQVRASAPEQYLLDAVEFEICTGLELPQAATIPHNATLPAPADGGGMRHYFAIESPEGLPAFLAEHFTPAGWEDVEAQMAAPDAPGQKAWWDPEKLKRLACYRRTYTDEFNTTYEIYAAFDQAANVLYLLVVEPRRIARSDRPGLGNMPRSQAVGLVGGRPAHTPYALARKRLRAAAGERDRVGPQLVRPLLSGGVRQACRVVQGGPASTSWTWNGQRGACAG